MNYFTSPSELRELQKSGNLVILDTRAGSNSVLYNGGHIPGALPVDPEKILTGEKGIHGGRHPLPSMEKFHGEMEKFGIGQKTRIVAYGPFSARLIFMLHIIGFNNGSTLSGDMEGWIKSGGDVSTSQPTQPRPGSFPCLINLEIVVEMEEIRKKRDKILLIDCRSVERHRGKREPIDKIAGSIPESINIHYEKGFDEDGYIKNKNILKSIFSIPIETPREVVLYCGSGVTACFNYLILKELNVDSRIYVGSWSDWISYSENLL